ncbi:hypothetical protein BBI09_00120 [Stutzerimonas xanthomarina]|nr:hypothetical protein BBI09_00120 [Stutzerimonas xanthomarina]
MNPNVVSTIKGLYVWSLELDAVAFTVEANDRVRLLFDTSAEFSGVLVVVRDDFINEFDLDNEWVGYWIHARDNVWLRFAVDGEWCGFTT